MDAVRKTRITLRIMAMVLLTIVLAVIPPLLIKNPIMNTFYYEDTAQSYAEQYTEALRWCHLGAIAALFALIGIVLFIPVLVEYAKTGLVPRFPTLIVSTVCIILGMLSLVCGLILDTVAKKHRQQFEVDLNIIQMLRQGR